MATKSSTEAAAAPAQKSYRVEMRNGPAKTVKASRYVSDGSGTRFYDADGEQVAGWSDGQVASVMREDSVSDAPAASAE